MTLLPPTGKRFDDTVPYIRAAAVHSRVRKKLRGYGKNTQHQEENMAIQEGKTAPAFTLPDAEGHKVALKDFKGKNVILYFYPKDDTPG
jgi:cytochrome oxidase Cu insertion factor (SCO1/SenC/PrrC family)